MFIQGVTYIAFRDLLKLDVDVCGATVSYKYTCSHTGKTAYTLYLWISLDLEN